MTLGNIDREVRDLYENPDDMFVAVSRMCVRGLLNTRTAPDSHDAPLVLRGQFLHAIGRMISCVSGIAFPLTYDNFRHSWMHTRNAASCIEWCMRVPTEQGSPRQLQTVICAVPSHAERVNPSAARSEGAITREAE